ncbi:hypothetical protein JAO29_02870 [Edaphobacter sp. HDX4]|uniref:hypothetical protein n=1 Tax=Edaphobacter sp. HDX4 TaxID=2794064 RepID=UPI002FE677FF
MLRTRTNLHDVIDDQHSLNVEQQQEVWRALEELLLSQPLRSTTQCQQLLRYIVEHTLAGELGLLRERVIGKEVFGRRPDYEPGDDPVVRIRAADLRKRLALYYQALPGPPCVKIDVPSGSYRATFLWSSEVVAPPPLEQDASLSLLASSPSAESSPLRSSSPIPSLEDAPVESVADQLRRSSRLSRPLILLLAPILLIVGLAGIWYTRRTSDPVRQFWAPMLADPRPVLISIGSNAVYRMGEREIDEYLSKTEAEQQSSEGMEFFPPLKPEQSFASTGLYPAPDSFVALADVAATTEIARMLTRYGKDFDERFPNDISFSEMREHSAVLIGGANNPITRDMTKNLPFVRRGRNWIKDRDHPDKGWELHASDDLHDTDDYAIITRLIAKNDAAPMVSVAGLGGHGTLAAAEFLCRPDYVKSLRAQLGPDWLNRNFQVVLHIKIIDFKPSSMEIVATRQW